MEMLAPTKEMATTQCGADRPLRETDKLRITGYPICANIILLKPFLHVDSARFVKIDPSPFHNAHHFLLPRIIQPLARVATFYVATKIKRRGRKAGFDVVAE